jgi:hypothetical protein
LYSLFRLRLRVTCITKAAGFDKDFFTAPETQRVGEIVEIDDVQIFLFLDHRLNDNPDALEKRKAVMMNVEPQRVLKIRRDKCDNLRFAVIKDSTSVSSTSRRDSSALTPRRAEEKGAFDFDDTHNESAGVQQSASNSRRPEEISNSSPSYATVARSGVRTERATTDDTICYICMKRVYRADCFMICNKFHYVCLAHMGIWDKARDRPHWEKMTGLATRYFEIARQKGRLDKFTEVRFLFCYSHFCKSATEQEMHMIMVKSLDYNEFTCQQCQSMRLESNISVAELRAQLYSSEASAASNFIPNAIDAAVPQSSMNDRDRAVVASDLNMTRFLPEGVYFAARKKFPEDEVKAIVNNMCIG